MSFVTESTRITKKMEIFCLHANFLCKNYPPNIEVDYKCVLYVHIDVTGIHDRHRKKLYLYAIPIMQ